MLTTRNRKLGFASIPTLFVLYLLFGGGATGIAHWFGFLAHKGEEKVREMLPFSVDVERLKYESGKTAELDVEIVEDLAATTVKKRHAERDLAVQKDRLSSTMKEFEYLETQLAAPELGEGEKAKYRAHRQSLLDRIDNLNGVVSTKQSVIERYDGVLGRLNEGRETVRRKKEEYETLISNSESLQLLKKTSPASSFNTQSSFAVPDAIADKIRTALEKDKMSLEIRNEAQSLFGRPVGSQYQNSIVERANTLLE